MRRKVAVIVDAPAAVPRELVDKYDIGILPLHAIVDGQDYLETQVDMRWLLERLGQKGDVQTTSAPSVGEVLKAYEWAAERADSAISIHMTSVFSKGYGAALEAVKMAKEKYPNMQFEAIDSQTVEAGEMPIALAAARCAIDGGEFDEVVKKAYEVRDATCSLYCFETLFYRDKGGRIFKAKAWAKAEEQSATGFKAMIEVDHSTGGTVQLVARAHAKKQLINKMAALAAEKVGDGTLNGAIVHIDGQKDAECLARLVQEKASVNGLVISHGQAVSAIQNGAGFVTFGFYAQ